MPELPDIVIYINALRSRIEGQALLGMRIVSPFLVRSCEPPVDLAVGKVVCELRRIGKRVVVGLDDGPEHEPEPITDSASLKRTADSPSAERLFLVFHLMIAGRFRWLKPQAKLPGKIGLAAFDFASGTLAVTETSTKKRASLHVVRGERALADHDPGGLEVLESDLDAFSNVLRRENHTLKRALTDPHMFSGIGNAYSDEILHAARLSPLTLTGRLTNEQVDSLFHATRETLNRWISRLSKQFGSRFPGPGEITAFRDGFATHGRFGRPCPDCGGTIQRIRYAQSETNYCPKCQTGGRILADRSLSRLLKNDWPRTADDPTGRA